MYSNASNSRYECGTTQQWFVHVHIEDSNFILRLNGASVNNWKEMLTDPMQSFDETTKIIDLPGVNASTIVIPHENRCHYGSLTGSFGILVQFLLALLAFSCLIGKYTRNLAFTAATEFFKVYAQSAWQQKLAW